jgi:hypothetical protein
VPLTLTPKSGPLDHFNAKPVGECSLNPIVSPPVTGESSYGSPSLGPVCDVCPSTGP